MLLSADTHTCPREHYSERSCTRNCTRECVHMSMPHTLSSSLNSYEDSYPHPSHWAVKEGLCRLSPRQSYPTRSAHAQATALLLYCTAPRTDEWVAHVQEVEATTLVSFIKSPTCGLTCFKHFLVPVKLFPVPSLKSKHNLLIPVHCFTGRSTRQPAGGHYLRAALKRPGARLANFGIYSIYTQIIYMDIEK